MSMTQAGGLPPPRSPGEVDSAALVLSQALIGLGKELGAAAQGQQADPVLMAKFRRIVLQVQDMFARAQANTAAQSSTAIEPQSGVAGANPTMDALKGYYQQGSQGNG